MNKLDLLKKQEDSEESIWTSISDLMSGLMIIFLFIAISFMVKIKEESKNAIDTTTNVKQIVDEYNKIKKDIYDDLVIAFEDKADEWNMVIEENGEVIKFKEPEVLFAEGDSQINPRFTEILNEFFPKYIETLYSEHKDIIKEIRIEGHTSSYWAQGVSELDSFFNNMELSQDRTRSVLNYVMSIESIKPYEDWLRKHMTANGMSSSRIIVNEQGLEDENMSRRVEFRIVTTAEEIIEEIDDKLYKGEAK